MTISFDYHDGEIVSSPTVIVSGVTSTSLRLGTITFTNNDNAVFPPQTFEVNSGHFKAIVHVLPNEENKFSVEVAENGRINNFGFVEYHGNQPRIVDKGTLLLLFYPLPQNKPVHLCVVVGKDSDGSFDMPHYRLQRGEVGNLETAIKKLKVAGRLMQAYTQDEMRTMGLSNRSFQFVEESQTFQGIFGYNVQSPKGHQEVKVHVLRSPKTVAQLRDPNLAQQNPNASDSGGLFSHAIELIKNTPDIYNRNSNTAVQCAVMYLDSTWDKRNNLILTHAALGGGTGEVKLAIFGSHGLHSWPLNFPQVTPSFLDGTHLSTNEVANDCNECGTSWECMNITMGAFMHEIGHLFGCPHQVDGVMLRDYVWWNRSFMTREVECLRRKTSGASVAANGTWPKVCHWNRLDIIRFLHHDSFSIPVDKFDKSYETTKTPNDKDQQKSGLSEYFIPNKGAVIKSNAGIYMVEFITKDLARYHKAWFPQAYGGPGFQYEVVLDYTPVYEEFKRNSKDAKEDFDVRVLSVGGEITIKNLKQRCSEEGKNVIKSDFGLNRGVLKGYKSTQLGRANSAPTFVGFDIRSIYKVRVFHGSALDGVKIFYTSGSGTTTLAEAPPPVPARNYLSRIKNSVVSTASPRAPSGRQENVAFIGKETGNYSDFTLNAGETITKFNFRNGAWIDAIQFVTSSGRVSQMYGNATGGHFSSLEAPDSQFTIVGMYGYVGRWMDGIGIIYTNEI